VHYKFLIQNIFHVEKFSGGNKNNKASGKISGGCGMKEFTTNIILLS